MYLRFFEFLLAMFIPVPLYIFVFVVQVHYILQEIVMGGMVLETNMSEILTHIEAQNKLEKSEVSPPV